MRVRVRVRVRVRLRVRVRVRVRVSDGEALLQAGATEVVVESVEAAVRFAPGTKIMPGEAEG